MTISKVKELYSRHYVPIIYELKGHFDYSWYLDEFLNFNLEGNNKLLIEYYDIDNRFPVGYEFLPSPLETKLGKSLYDTI